eukprot:COSAG01_NODE_28672_length_655_cov_15.086331_1_plen_109_part_10
MYGAGACKDYAGQEKVDGVHRRELGVSGSARARALLVRSRAQPAGSESMPMYRINGVCVGMKGKMCAVSRGANVRIISLSSKAARYDKDPPPARWRAAPPVAQSDRVRD